MRKLALITVVLCLGALVWQPAEAISFGSIRNSLIQWALSKVSVEGVFEISAEDVVGAETEGTTLRGVEIADADGVWFRAESLTFDFDRARLLLGQIIIENLALDGVEMLRQPVIPAGEQIDVDLEGVEAPPEPDTPFAWPRSPVTTAINHLALTDVTLHEAVLGQAIRFDATGSFRDQGAIQSAALDLDRTDTVEGVIDFEYSRDFSENTLALTLDAHEAAGGLVALLGGLPADVPVAVDLKADGTPDAFGTNFDLVLTDFVEANGKAMIDYAGPLAIDGSFTVRPGERMPPQIAQVLGDEAELVVKAGEGPDQTVRIETAHIDSPYLDATVDGTWARATGEIDANVDLTAAPGLAAPLEGVEFAGLRFTGEVTGAPGALSADGRLTLDGLETPQAGARSAVLDVTFGQSGPAGATVSRLDATGDVDGLRLDRVGADVIGEARVTLTASLEGDEARIETAMIDSRVLHAEASGSADIATGDLALDFAVNAPSLTPVLDAYAISGAGAIDMTGRAVRQAGVLRVTTTAALRDFATPAAAATRLTLDGTVVQATGRTTFELTGAGEALRIDQVGPDVLEHADLRVAGTLENAVLVLDRAVLDTAVLDIGAEGRMMMRSRAGRLDLRLTAPDLAPVAAAYGHDLAGALAATGTLGLTPEGWELTADAALTDLAGDIDAERLEVTAQLDRSGTRTAFDVRADSAALGLALAGEELSGPVDLALVGALDDGLLTFETARVASPVLSGNFDARLDLGDFSGTLAYDVTQSRLAAIAPLLGIDAGGVAAVQGTAELAPASAGGTASARGTASVSRLAVGTTFVGDLAATYDLALADAPSGTLRLTLTESPFAPDAPTAFSLEMIGPPDDWHLSFDLDAPNYLAAEGAVSAAWAGPLAVNARASATPGAKLRPEIAQVLGDRADLVVEAAEDSDGTIRIETARLSSPALRADVSGTLSPESGAANLDASLVAEPELAAPFEGIEFAGLRFDGKVTGAPGALSGTGDLVLDGFASPQVGLDSATLRIDVSQAGATEGTPEDGTQDEAERTTDTPPAAPAAAPITRIAIGGTMDGLRVAEIDPEAIGEARIRLDGALAGDILTIETAGVESDLVDLHARGTANVATMAFDIDYDLTAPALGPVARSFGVDATGALGATGRVTRKNGALRTVTEAELSNLRSPSADARRLTLRAEATQRGSRTAFDVTGTGDGVRIDRLGPEVIGNLTYETQGALAGDWLTLDRLHVGSSIVEATAGGTVNLATGKGRLTYEVTDVALPEIGAAYDLNLAGTAGADGTVGLAAGATAAGPRVVGTVNATGVAYDGTAIGALVLTHDVALGATPGGTLELALSEGPYAPAKVATAFRLDGQRLTLDGLRAEGFGAAASADLAVNLETMAAEGGLQVRATEGAFAPADAQTHISLAGNRLALRGLTAEASGLAARGDVTVNLDTLLAEGVLRIDDADLAALGDTVGTPLAGTARGTLRLTGDGGQQGAALDLDLLGVNAAGVALGEAQIDGRVADALGTPRLDLSVKMASIISDALHLDTATVTARGPLSGIEIALQGEGELNDAPLAISAAARADLAGAATQVTVGQMEIALDEDRITLAEPLTVTAQGGNLRVANLHLTLPENGRLTGDFTRHGGPVSGTLLVDAPDISVLGTALDMPITSGSLKLDATFDTRRSSAGAQVTLAGRDIVTDGLAGTEALTIDGTLGWDGAALDLDLRATGGFERPLVVDATLPVRATSGLPALADRGPVSAHVDWEGDLGTIWGLVPVSGHVLTGDTTLALDMTGDISAPVVTGDFRLADGIYQNLDSGVVVTGLSLATTLESAGMSGLRLVTAEGADAELIINGPVAFDGEGTNLTVKTRKGLVVRRDDAILRAGVDLAVTNDPDGRMAIAGTIRILEAEVRLVNATPPEIVTLGEVRIKGQPLVISDAEPSLPIRLAIDITAPGRIFVRGRGLDSQWDIDLQLRGTASSPRITGKIAAVRGSLDLIGREFDLETGEVLFSGSPVIDPRLNVVMVRATEDLTGRIVIGGSALDPTLTFDSTPALPEDEVLPRLLFGTSAQALTPAQGMQLALGLATLMNGGGGTLDQVRTFLGLDALSIEQGDEGAMLQVGKQVSKRVWVGTRQSLEGDGTTVAVEVDVWGNVETYGEVDTEGETTVGVQWRKDF